MNTLKQRAEIHLPALGIARHMSPLIFVALTLIAIFAADPARGEIAVERAERTQKDDWVRDHLLETKKAPPFSFVYNGKSSDDLLPSWPRKETRRSLDANRIEHVISWTSPADHLLVKCVAVEYSDYPMVEWTVYFRNEGSGPTPILENIQGLDTRLSREGGAEFVLNGNHGDFCSADSYRPYQIVLNPSAITNFAPPSYSGKSCDGPQGWPYYNLQVPGGGIILAIGWPGQWASSFKREGESGLRIQAGQQTTHLFLKPGEEIRTPLIAVLFAAVMVPEKCGLPAAKPALNA